MKSIESLVAASEIVVLVVKNISRKFWKDLRKRVIVP